MSSRIFCGLIALLIISTGTVFAQESLISVQTDNNHYNEGNTIVISGTVTTVIGDTPATLQFFSEDNLIDIAQITIAQDGSYSHTVIAEGPLWQKPGDYIVRVSYGEGNIAETEFSYTPKTKTIVATTKYEVKAGSHGTFDVEYTIQGGTIKDMVIDSDIFALIIQINAVDEGIITIDLPREFIGAEKQNGKDDIFIVLIDEIPITYQETLVLADSRSIAMNFEQGDSDIKIIGTYVVPEFESIVMIILITGIMTSVLLTRNKFVIRN